MNNNTKKVLLHLIWAIALTLSFTVLFLSISWVNSPTSFEFKLSMDNNAKSVFENVLNSSSFYNPNFEVCKSCCDNGYLSVQCGFCDCQEDSNGDKT